MDSSGALLADGVPPFLSVEQTGELLHRSPRAIHEATRTRSIPMRKPRGTRRVLIPRDELTAWLDGADLEIVETADGSVIVRPVEAVAR